MKRALVFSAALATTALFPAIGSAGSDAANPAAITAFVKAAKGAKKVKTFTGTLESPFSIVSFLLSLLALPAAYFYLYRRDNVVHYFEAHGPRRTPK